MRRRVNKLLSLSSKRVFSTAQTKIARRKNHINVGTIGDPQSGKTTLLKALVNFMNFRNECSEEWTGPLIDFVSENEHKLSDGASSANFHNIEYESDTRHFLQSDTPSRSDLIANVINGTAQTESLVCVVDSSEGLGSFAKEVLRCVMLSHHHHSPQGSPDLLSLPELIFFINKCDDSKGGTIDDELRSLVELELSEFTEEILPGFLKILSDRPVSIQSRIIHGSALTALNTLEKWRKGDITKDNVCEQSILPIRQLVDCLESTPLTDEKDALSIPASAQNDFLMPVQTVYNLTGVGIASIGKVLSGSVTQQGTVNVIGLSKNPKLLMNQSKSGQKKTANASSSMKSRTTNSNSHIQSIPHLTASVASLKLFMKPLKTGVIRDYLGIALHGDQVSSKTVKRGMYIHGSIEKGKGNAKDESLIRFVHCFEMFARMYLWSAQNEGCGRSTPVSSGYSPVFYFITSEIVGSIDLSEVDSKSVRDSNLWETGMTLHNVKVVLSESCVVWEGLPFLFRDGGSTIGHGYVTKPVQFTG